MVQGGRTSILVDLVTINQNSRPIPGKPLRLAVLYRVPPNREIMAVVELEGGVCIPDLKPLNRDPPDRVLRPRTVLKTDLFASSLVDKVNNRELTGKTEELDGCRGST